MGKGQLGVKPPQGQVSEWYLRNLQESQIFDNGPVTGTMIIRPYGYAIWEQIQHLMGEMIKDMGVSNAYFPLFIPENLLTKEQAHVAGFSPECAFVTEAGGKRLEERWVVRPTSETIICHAVAKWVKTYKDLPVLLNQWCSVVRTEKRTQPFLRTTEFLWQEGHCFFATQAEAEAFTLQALMMYQHFFRKVLAIPVLIGRKSASERFPGAVDTTCCEALMMSGKALQVATSHHLGQTFTDPEVFGITYRDVLQALQTAWYCSWGASTRMVAALFLTHGDQLGLVLPPQVAPTQAIIIPIFKKGDDRNSIIEACGRICADLKHAGVRVQVDASDNSPGWKFSQHEQRGVPLRLEIGPRDLESDSATGVRRDNGRKVIIPLGRLQLSVVALLADIQHVLLEQAQAAQDANTRSASSFEEMIEIIKDQRGFVRASWCGGAECEAKVKEEMGATNRCIPLEPDKDDPGSCVVCGRPAVNRPYWAKAY